MREKKSDKSFLHEFYCESNQYDKVCESLEKYWQYNNIELDDFIPYSFAMLKIEKYKEIYMLLKKYYDNPATCSAPIAINYFIAEAKYKNINLTKRKLKIKL